MDKKRNRQNRTRSNICQSNSNEGNAKAVTLSKEFIDAFTQIIFREN
jgi:hypothetical protein